MRMLLRACGKLVTVLTANPAEEFHVRCHTTTSDILSALKLKQGMDSPQPRRLDYRIGKLNIYLWTLKPGLHYLS